MSAEWLRQLTGNEKLRFVLAGAWNSAFGWLSFALIWWLGHSWLNLWTISALAHLLATTQAFWVQRHLVFQQTNAPAWAQYVRFQVSYLVLLAIGSFMLNALAAQGVHPLLAQVIGMVLLAVGGFVMGKSFTFSSKSLSLRAGWDRLRGAVASQKPALACFIVSLAIFEWCWGSRFYSSTTHLGHDFSLTGIGLLEGKYWIDSNGWMAGLFNPPWFTPAWCAGSALYADPQSAFYSPLQWLAFFVDPFLATHLNTLLFASVAFWGSLALSRRVMQWQLPAALVFATLGMANQFLPMRSAVGEAGYQPLYLWTLLALALCWPSAKAEVRSRTLWPTIGVALVLTAWLQFGFAGMMVPAFLATLALCLVLVILGRANLNALIIRATAGATLAILINSSKLYESVSLMRNFPRDFYALPGFPALGDALLSIVFALLQPSEWTTFFASRRLAHLQFMVFPHEWALGFGLGALVMALGAGIVLLKVRQEHQTHERQAAVEMVALQQWLSFAGTLVILLVPVLLLWDQGAVRELLKRIPILNSAAWPMRWIVIYIPLTQMLLAAPLQGLFTRVSARHGLVGVVLATAAIWAGPLTEPLDYYLSDEVQAYDPKPVLKAYEWSRSKPPIAIERVVVPPATMLYSNRNDVMLQGQSQGLCYNPIYGYRLESFPQIGRLINGPALGDDGHGQTLILNPACLVHPRENQCKLGDGFVVTDSYSLEQAKHFLSRRPFEWRRANTGQFLAWISQACVWLLLVLVGLGTWQAILRLLQGTTPRERCFG